MCYQDLIGGTLTEGRVKAGISVFARVSMAFAPVGPIHLGNPGLDDLHHELTADQRLAGTSTPAG